MSLVIPIKNKKNYKEQLERQIADRNPLIKLIIYIVHNTCNAGKNEDNSRYRRTGRASEATTGHPHNHWITTGKRGSLSQYPHSRWSCARRREGLGDAGLVNCDFFRFMDFADMYEVSSVAKNHLNNYNNKAHWTLINLV